MIDIVELPDPPLRSELDRHLPLRDHPLVRAVLEQWPGAEIVAVRIPEKPADDAGR